MIRIPWWPPVVSGWLFIVLSIPVRGLHGAALALLGSALVWIGVFKWRGGAR